MEGKTVNDKWKRYELHPPYRKPGDDLAEAMDNFSGLTLKDGHAKAFLRCADLLEVGAQMLRRAASLAAEGQLCIEDADVQYISVKCPEFIGDQLVEEGFLSVIPSFDDHA